MNDQFKAGDKVRLKSGGPTMTVERFDTLVQQYCCVWFAKDVSKRDLFDAAVLEPAESAPTVESVSMKPSSRLAGPSIDFNNLPDAVGSN
jgi:uncharacterized protein YodC (DUF2158 family)